MIHQIIILQIFFKKKNDNIDNMRVLSCVCFCTYLFSYQCYCGCSCKGNNGNNGQKGELTQTHESVIRLKIDKDLKLYNDGEEEINGNEKLSKVNGPIKNILKNFKHHNRNIINLLKYALHEDEKDSKTEGGEKVKSEEEKKEEEEEDKAKNTFLSLAERFLNNLANEEIRDKFFNFFKLENFPDEKIYEFIIKDVLKIVGNSSKSTLKEIFDYLLKLKLPSDFYFNLHEIGDDIAFLLSKSTYEFAREVINSKFFNSIDKLEQIICNLISIAREMGNLKDSDTAEKADFYCRAFAYILCNFVKPIINGFALPCNTKGHGEYYLIYLPKQVFGYCGNLMGNLEKFEKFINDSKKKIEDTYEIIFSKGYILETNNNKKLHNIDRIKMADIYENKNTDDPDVYGEFKFKYCEKNNNPSSTSNNFENEKTVLSHDDIKEMSEYLNMNPQDLINEIKNNEIQNLNKFIYDKFMDSIKNLYSNMVSNCNTAQMILNKKLKIELNLKPEEDLKPEENLKSEEED